LEKGAAVIRCALESNVDEDDDNNDDFIAYLT